MNEDTELENALPPQTGCMTSLVFYRLRRDLLEVLPGARDRIRPSATLVEIIPRPVRRNVWRQLKQRGYRLPPLELSPAIWLVSAVSVLGRSALLALLFNNTLFLAAIFPFAFLAFWASRPFAIHPPVGCETLREAVLLATPFRRVDYEAGFWPRSDISAKVRIIVAKHAGIPFDQVREDSRFSDLFGF